MTLSVSTELADERLPAGGRVELLRLEALLLLLRDLLAAVDMLEGFEFCGMDFAQSLMPESVLLEVESTLE